MNIKFKFLTLVSIFLLSAVSLQAQTDRRIVEHTTTYNIVERERNWELHAGAGPIIHKSFSKYANISEDGVSARGIGYIGLKQNIRFKNIGLSIIFNENIGKISADDYIADLIEYYDEYGRLIGNLAFGLEYKKEYKPKRSFFADATLGFTFYGEGASNVGVSHDGEMYTNLGLGILFNNRFSISAQVHWFPNSSEDPITHFEVYDYIKEYNPNMIQACIQIGCYLF